LLGRSWFASFGFVHALLTIVACVAGVIGFDWLATTSAGAKAWSFDYRYWPMSKPRMASVILLAVAVTAQGLFMKPDPDNPPVWWIFLLGPSLVIWLATFWVDFLHQRRTEYREDSDNDE
jgi:hypothetical protein